MGALIARLIGGAGTGKTTELLRIMAEAIDAGGLDPDQIGFVSFTRAARSEAATRAADRFECRIEDLEQRGWFRTLHSICYRCLGAGDDLLVDDRKSRKWIEETLQQPLGDTDSVDDDGMGVVTTAGKTDAAKALAMWHAARNRLSPFKPIWEIAAEASPDIPGLEWCEEYIGRYELHKRIDHRRDFTDLLGQFAGWRFAVEGPEATKALGEVPELPVWFFDEQQDASRLLDSVCHRLINTDTCRWVYVVGDPFQAIYGFAGADSRCFREWDAAKERVMPKSYRCPAPVHELGESILSGCSDYWNRGIAAADHSGEVEVHHSIHESIGRASPKESWLFIARTNFQARRFANLLNKEGIPWVPTKGNGGWAAPVRNLGLAALFQLGHRYPIMPEEWKAALNLIPSKYGEDELLVRGTKTRWQDSAFRAPSDMADVNSLEEWGASAKLCSLVRSGSWVRVIEHGETFAAAAAQWGLEAVSQPSVKVGTVHSVKGAEADNVVLLTTTSGPIAKAAETTEGADEERRVAYVGVTRARRRLIVVNEPRERNKMEVEL